MIALFYVTFIFIALRAFQQLNVMGGHYRLVVPTSCCMALSEVVIVLQVVDMSTMWAAVPMGLGGGLGSCFSMYLHRRYIKQ